MDWRFWHRWVSLFIALPFLVILVTGILLATRAFNPLIQPVYPKAAGAPPQISFEQILQIAKSENGAGISSWADVDQVDVRPKNGEIRVRAKRDHWEVVIDGSTGKVLGVGQRRVPWLTSVHQGAFFGETVRYGIFLPAAVGVFFLLLSGLYLFFLPYLRKRRRSTFEISSLEEKHASS
ncbi:MAG TPA: PepSY-associated TM helix domain-containing protein [Bdellovibrionota bacterium]|jgi:uncharacterized iron-regulated membrane protein